jgi:uncharacterized membrane protein
MDRQVTATLVPAQGLESDRGGLPSTDGLSLRTWLLLFACMGLVLGLLGCRLWWARTSGHLSLLWDLALGWTPLLLAWLLHRAADRSVNAPRRAWRRGVLLLLAAGWLLFFPNAPYLITELIHLDVRHYGPSERAIPTWLRFLADGPRRAVPPWLDLLLLISVAWCGVMLTFGSLGLIHAMILRRLRRGTAALAVCLLILLASFGVALGRFDRFNSWDVFKKPGTVAWRIGHHVVEPADDPRVLVSTIVLAALLAIGYFTITERKP